MNELTAKNALLWHMSLAAPSRPDTPPRLHFTLEINFAGGGAIAGPKVMTSTSIPIHERQAWSETRAAIVGEVARALQQAASLSPERLQELVVDAVAWREPAL